LKDYLEYEGQYLYNRKWNGKGYDENGNIIYELFNGNGKVKEYDECSCDLIFEGEYLNGKLNGKGKEYSFGELIYEGDFLNGQRNGKGKEYYRDGRLRFEGEYLNGERIKRKMFSSCINIWIIINLSFNFIYYLIN